MAATPPPGPHPTADLGIYVLEALPSPESTRLRQHLESCVDCRRRVDELEGLSELIAAARLVPEPPPGLAEMVLATLPPQSANTADPWRVPGPGTLIPPTDDRAPAPVGIPPRPPAPARLASDPESRTVLGDGDFVLTPDEDRVRIDVARNRAIAVGATVVLVVALLVAAVVFALAPDRATGETVTLFAADEGGATGTVTQQVVPTGTRLIVRIEGLAAGDYVVAVGEDGTPAGSFTTDGTKVEVELHTSATAGDVTVSGADSPDRAVLSGRLG